MYDRLLEKCLMVVSPSIKYKLGTECTAKNPRIPTIKPNPLCSKTYGLLYNLGVCINVETFVALKTLCLCIILGRSTCEEPVCSRFRGRKPSF